MPLVETLPVGDGCAQWPVWATTARIVVTDPDRLAQATSIVRAELDAVDTACSRFRPDSELEAAARDGGRAVPVSNRLAGLVSTALAAARDTNGDVDPTLAAALTAIGYDRDFADLGSARLQAGGSTRDRATGPSVSLTVSPIANWRDIKLEQDHTRAGGCRLTIPRGVRLDLGATAKAWAADRCAALVASACRTGVLVSLGGDIATAGPNPDGWTILVQDGAGQPASSVDIPAGAAIATSSTISRQWTSGPRTLHHILDPRTGAPAPRVWRTASVVAGTCVAANTASTAAIVRGHRAPAWLSRLDLAARLVDVDGAVITVGGWPQPVEVTR